MAQIISIFSPKGGVGKTFIATNLSVAFAQKFIEKKILLLDMDLELPGDSATMLDLKPDKGLIELIPAWEKREYVSRELNKCISYHKNANLYFTSFILKRSGRLYVNIEESFISAILSDLGKDYDYIIVDSGRAYNKLLFSFFGLTNLILMVVNPDILSVYKTKEAINILQSFHFPLRMIKVILNRAESLGSVGWEEVMAALPVEIIARIPSEGKAVVSALNRRIPLALENRRSKVSLALGKLIDSLIAHPEFFILHQELEVFRKAITAAKEADFTAEAAISSEVLESEKESIIGRQPSKEDEFDKLKQRIHKRIIAELELKRFYKTGTDLSKDKELRDKTMAAITNALAEETGTLVSSTEARKRLVKEITDEVLGLGPLEDLIADPEISDIMVNNKNNVYVERKGKIEFTSKTFVSDEHIRRVIERIIAPLGRRIDESVPMVDARLSDGSRVNAIIPPLSLTGPTLTIRKFFSKRLIISDLIKLGAVNETMGDFIKACVLARKNIIVSGGTGSGKTTVLNVLSEFISDGERIITIEDAAELKLHHSHWVRLESRPPNIEGKGMISIRELFRNSLRMRPDRIIIGECRGPETLDMLQAMNTGHDGSMTTLHANSTQDVLARLDSLILMSGIEIPLRAIREMIASAIDIIVHTARLSDGSRKITQVTEITGMLDEMHVGLNDIFIFNQAGLNSGGKIQGEFQATGNLPTFLDDLHKQGISLAEETFKKRK